MTMNSEITWPPAYLLKRHARARHVKLKASPSHGLEIVVPTRFNLKNIPAILEENKLWIQKRLHEIQATIPKDEGLPTVLHLRALNQSFIIHYLKSNNKKIKLFERHQGELVLMGDVTDHEQCKKILTIWIKRRAQLFLSQLLQTLSQETQLKFTEVVIRGQRTRWGSCSSSGLISLNYKLIFLPSHLTRHILIHELCHTIHLNHSAKFWRLVASFDAQWKAHNREIRQSENLVPYWI